MEERIVTLLFPSNLKVPLIIPLIKVQQCFKNKTEKLPIDKLDKPIDFLIRWHKVVVSTGKGC